MQLTNPVKLKENLITQMRTQINDLEKFIDFLKGKTSGDTRRRTHRSFAADSAKATVPNQNKLSIEAPQGSSSRGKFPSTTQTTSHASKRPQQNFASDNQRNFAETMKKVLVLTQLYTFLLLTCGTRTMQKKSNQPTPNMKKDLVAKKHFG